MLAFHSPTCDVVDALTNRARRHGADPLVTWYDPSSAARAEFSARTFANWVDKTVNLLDEMELTSSRVANTLLTSSPMHWTTLVWTMAIWQAGGIVEAVPVDAVGAGTAAAVVGPGTQPTDAGVTISCSLHPLGAPLGEPATGVIDFAEVLSQPDVHQRFDASDLVCFTDGTEHTWQDLAAIPPLSHRVLLEGTTQPWKLVSLGLAGPLLGGGSVVLVVGDDHTDIGELLRQEKAHRA